MKSYFSKISSINGGISLPGDKSISHRSLLFSALAEGTSTIKNLLDSEDIQTTRQCLQELGVKIKQKDETYFVEGIGKKGFKEPKNPLYCGNSGTTTRLISGILAAQSFPTVLIGDDSLSKRPMKRVIEPLTQMGCNFESNEKQTLPLKIFPSGKINSIDFHLKVASAQVKGAILLAGLHSEDITSVTEDTLITRDHTERMLNLSSKKADGRKITKVSVANYPKRSDFLVPGDFSTAAFFIVLGLIVQNSHLVLNNVSLNKTRIFLIDILKKMGGNITIEEKGQSNNEPYGNIQIINSKLKNIEINKELIPGIIDEIPILSIAGIFAEDDFEIRGAEELRVKESDRIKSVTSNIKKTGLKVKEYEDGFAVTGKMNNECCNFESYGDHRIAMAFAVLSCLVDQGGEVNDFECAAVSNPHFIKQLESIKSR
jgi:3-phosphoshikimate 1-carboxyvinyltransferase